MISKTGEAETITTHYLFCLGLYRALYIFNWVWRYYFEGFFEMIAIVAGVVQTILYCDFFYLYVTKGGLSLGIISLVDVPNQTANYCMRAVHILVYINCYILSTCILYNNDQMFYLVMNLV